MGLERDNQTLPAGKLYFDPKDSDDNYEGFRFLGNAPEFTLTLETEFTDHFDSTNALRKQDKRVPIQQTRTAQPTIDDPTPENFELFFAGDLDEYDQPSGTGEEHVEEDVTLERWYRLNPSASNPFGDRDVSSVAVEDDGDATSYDEGDDYEIDTETGLIKFLEDGGISEGDDIKVSYDKADTSWKRIQTSNGKVKEGRLLLISDNSEGEEMDYFMPEVTLSPSGDLVLINDGSEWQQMQFELAILEPSGDEEAIQVVSRPGVT